MEKKVSLNLLMTYPVYWNDFRILRDFVQNFYDAKGHDKWWSDFKYQYKHKVLTMRMKNSGFSYEWLMHIGASSKQENIHQAGFFGEGFKIAALCAVRDKHWKVQMAAQDWQLSVVKEEIHIDGQKKYGLAYDIQKRKHNPDSILILSGVERKQYEIFLDVLMSFYYKENPLIGEKLYENNEVAVYTRTEIPIPEKLPSTCEFGNKGIVFCRYQALGTIPFPCVIAYHNYSQKDRERKNLRDYDVLEILYLVAEQVDAVTAKVLLEHIYSEWNHYPEKQVDIKSWYYVVCELVRRIATSKEVTEEFRREHPNLLYAKRFYKDDIRLYNRRRQAKAWLKIQPVKYILVQEIFKKLGFQELEAVCEAAGGFSVDDEPTELESRYLLVLHKLVDDIFKGFFLEYENIHYKIIRNNSACMQGKAEVFPEKRPLVNVLGIKKRSQIKGIYLKQDMFNSEKFGQAVAVYLHELSHMFGGDASAGFSRALTSVCEILANHSEKVQYYQKQWEDICY